MEKGKIKKDKFNPSKYATEYIKNHYKRKEIKLKPLEVEKLEKVLKFKNQDLKTYTLENVEKDLYKIKENAKK